MKRWFDLPKTKRLAGARNGQADATYLQPAAESLSAYILPMSPMPIRPTTKFSIPDGMVASLEAIARTGVDNRVNYHTRILQGQELQSTASWSLASRESSLRDRECARG